MQSLFTADDLRAAANALTISARLEGPNHLLLLDVGPPAGAAASLRPAIDAACALHHAIEADDDLADIEETLEDALKGDDPAAIDAGCDLYRALLADRLVAILSGGEGQARLAHLAASARD